MDKILVSISGGRTSAMMAFLIKNLYGKTHEIIYVFANTGKEREETLQFLDRVDKHFGLGVVWVEAEVIPENNKGTTHKVVDFKTAARDGEPYEQVIKKYGIPCVAAPHCTRELKTNSIKSYAKSIGWLDYKIAIGYRADEPKRIKWKKVTDGNHIYPLVTHGIKKEDVNAFWKKQPFDLELKSYEGNCDLCFKKSKRKLLTIVKENPLVTGWWGKMELRYSNHRPESHINSVPPFYFYRGCETSIDLIEESRLPFDPAPDENKALPTNQLAIFTPEMDNESGCGGGSCEPFTEEISEPEYETLHP